MAVLVKGLSRALFLARWKGVALGLLGLTLLAGGLAAASGPAAQEDRPAAEPGLTLRVPREDPLPDLLVAYLNDNARRVKAVECRNLFMRLSVGGQNMGGLEGFLAYRSPRDCRLVAHALGSTELDLGCNQRECWFWMKRALSPRLQIASRKDVDQGGEKWPLPFRVEWIAVALGFGEYDTNAKYEVVSRPGHFELADRLAAPGGGSLRRVTKIGRKPAACQVTGYRLENDQGQVVCAVDVSEYEQDKDSGAVLPRRLQIDWPAKKARIQLTLDRVRVNSSIDEKRAAVLFTPPNYLKE
jgi:hypothetical protein